MTEEIRKEACKQLKQTTTLTQVAALHNLDVFDVPSDGNCGFHAICHQLSLSGIHVNPKDLRCDAITFLRFHPQFITEEFLLSHNYNNIDAYLKANAIDGKWVDEVILRAVGACLRRPIYILHDNGHTTKLNCNELLVDDNTKLDEGGTINIGLIAELHYVSLVNIEPVVEMATESGNVDPVNSSDVPTSCSSSTFQSCEWPAVWSEEVWLHKKEQYKFYNVAMES